MRAYRERGIAYWDAVDPRLYEPVAPAHRRRSSRSRSRPIWPTSGWRARSACRPAAGELSFWVDARHRADVGLLLRRGASGRLGRLDDAARRERPHEPGHRQRVPVLARAAPVPRALPDGRRTRAATPTGTTGEWHAASGRSFGYEQWTIDLSQLRRPDDRDLAELRERRRRRLSGRLRRRHRGAGRPRHRRRSRTTATRWTAGRCRARPRAASRTRTTGRSAPPRTRRSRSAPTIDASLAQQPEVLDFLVVALRPLPVLARRAGSSTSRRSASRWRRRRGRSTRPAFFTDPQSGEDVVVHELAHQWAGDT